MQIKLGSYKELHAALEAARSKIDSIPAYHGKVFSYTIYQKWGRYCLFLNRKENIYGSI